MKLKFLMITLIGLFITFSVIAEAGPMASRYTDGYRILAEAYREQDGYAIVTGRKLHYWLYDSITYKNRHGGDTSIIYNQVIPKWLEDMGYVIDYDNIYVVENNTALANSVRMLMKQRGTDISVTLITDVNPNYACINEYFPSKNIYKFTYYPLYK